MGTCLHKVLQPGTFLPFKTFQAENVLSILLQHQRVQPACEFVVSCVLLLPLLRDFTTDLASQTCLQAEGSVTRGEGYDLNKVEMMRSNLVLFNYDLNYNINTG